MDRKATKKPPRAKKTAPDSGTWSDDSALRIALTLELYNVVTDSALAVGISNLEQQEALRRAALHGRERVRPSRSVLKIGKEVSLLLGTWRRDPRYLQADGTPKALPIFGTGASLESLVKFCVPDVPVSDVVSILCTHSDVKRLKGDKVALLGNPVKITERSPITSVAWLTTQVRHVAETVVFNDKIPASARGEGRFERMIWGTLPKKQFEEWAQAVRQPLQETSDRVEAQLEQKQPADADENEKVCGIGIFVFREDGNIG